MRLALVEVYEVASFYAHFDIVLEDEQGRRLFELTVRVCDSLTCELSGANALLADLQDRLGEAVRVVRAPCMGGCNKGAGLRDRPTRCTSTPPSTASPTPSRTATRIRRFRPSSVSTDIAPAAATACSKLVCRARVHATA